MASITTSLIKTKEQTENKNLGPMPFWLCLTATIIIIILTTISYRGTLFCPSVWDPGWLKEATANPILIARQFYQPWWDDHAYYRPLTSVIWAAQYLLWGSNGLCFRWNSIVWMLLSSLMVGLIVFEISKTFTIASSRSFKIRLYWAVASAALFAWYPLHCEPINWILAQHDVLVTLFYLLSFWCYIKWRQMHSIPRLILSLLTFICALGCKEMAVSLPLVLFAYDLFYPAGKSRIALALLPYWLILLSYFCLRKIALGAFIGDGPVLYYSGLLASLHAWLHALRQIFVPINNLVITNNTITMLWQITIILVLGLSFYALKAFKNVRTGGFLVFWFLLSLAPTCKLFDIGPDLFGSRLGYLSTVPLCMLLTYGIATLEIGSKFSRLARTAGGALFILSIIVLYCNNQFYASAIDQANQIMTKFQQFCRSKPKDSQIRILGLPVLASGTINCDTINWQVLDALDQSFPLGLLKESIVSKKSSLNFVYWDGRKQSFKPVVFYSTVPDHMKSFEDDRLKSIIHSTTNPSAVLSWNKGKDLHINSSKRSYLDLNLTGLPCWPTDFIQFRMKFDTPPANTSQYQFDLRFLNDIGPNYSWKEYPSWVAFSRATIVPTGKEQSLIFPLRPIPEWAMGGKCHSLRLIIPPHCDIRLTSISIPKAKDLIPMINCPATIQLNHLRDHQLIHYDASSIQGCAQVALEVIAPEHDFERLYSSCAEPSAAAEINFPGSSGQLDLCRSSFPGSPPGVYKARLRALDKDGKQVGLSGDHFLIDVS